MLGKHEAHARSLVIAGFSCAAGARILNKGHPMGGRQGLDGGDVPPVICNPAGHCVSSLLKMRDVDHQGKTRQVGRALLTKERLLQPRHWISAGNLQGHILPLLLLGLLTFGILQAQTRPVHIRFAPTYEGAPLVLGAHYRRPPQDSVVFETLRFYVSELQLLQDSKAVAAMAPRHRLLDLEDAASLTFALAVDPKQSFNKITFQLGIDSLTNVSGALGGDLDPTKGMYWAWQSGYINFKLEGKTPSCPARNHLFQFHLGGYLPPCANLQVVELPVYGVPTEIVIQFALDEFLAQIDMRDTYEVMRPSPKAVQLAGCVAKTFKCVE
jgi:hypothetical protein